MKYRIQSSFFSFIFAFPLFAFAENYLPLILKNNSGFSNDQVYIVAKALDSKTKKDCFLQFKENVASCVPVTATTSSVDFSYTMKQLESFSELKIPPVESGRIYFSVGSPMYLPVNSADNKIIDADGFLPRDTNYYTLYDKIEFSYVVNTNANGDVTGGSWVNPTAVDNFSLPLRIEQPGAASHMKAAGLTGSRVEIFNALQSEVRDNDTTDSQEWQKLFLEFKGDDFTTPLRFMATGKAMVNGIAGTTPFDEYYLNNGRSHDYAFNYVDKTWEFYETNTLLIDATEIQPFFKLNSYLFTGHVEGDTFIFTNEDGSYVERIEKPENSLPFFAGANGTFDHQNNTPKAVIVKNLTAAFIVGLLPALNGTLLNTPYLKSQKDQGKYYTENDYLGYPAQGPWYDLYGKALHIFGDEQPIYTFAYDDVLAQDGTLHDPNVNNISPVTVTLGDMTGTTIPEPFNDDSTYTVTVGLNDEFSTVIYNGEKLKSGQTLENVTMPFTVIADGNVANIYIKYPMVKPYYEGSNGIVIDHVPGTQVAMVAFPCPNCQ